MSGVARIVLPGIPHHVTQRGNNRQDVFFVDDDRRVYLRILGEQSDRYGLAVLGYCLMANHVHLIATPSGDESLAKAVGRTDFLYTQYINRRHGRSGHLWQNRFFSCALDEPHLWAALRARDDQTQAAGLRRSTCRGRPLGSNGFLSKLEHPLGRRLRPLPVGRPGNKRGSAGRNKEKQGTVRASRRIRKPADGRSARGVFGSPR